MTRSVRATRVPQRVHHVVVGVIAVVVLALTAGPALAATPQPASRVSASDRGSWHVTRLAANRWQIGWTSPTRLPVRSARPEIVDADGTSIGVPTTAADGRTVLTTVVARTAPSPAALGVTLSGVRLDRSVARRSRAVGRAPAAQQKVTPRRLLDVDPGVAGPYATTSSDYVRPSVKIAGMAQPIEMVGHVVEPVADAQTGPRPLVLFLHGRHDYCYKVGKGAANDDWPCRGVMHEVPSQLGYVYIQQLLASQGYTTVSIRVNGINAQDYRLADGGASARATIVQKHLDYWATIAKAHQVDLSRVVLVGHSRGGEGVDRASIRIPLSAPYRIVGQVLIAPTDFGYQSAADVPTVTLLPYCDGDVSDLEGQRFTDVARDQSTGDTALKSSVLIMGADHNFFNTEWTPGISQAPSMDDWSGPATQACGRRTPERLSAAGQRAVGKAYVAGAIELFTAPTTTAQSVLPMFDGSAVAVRSAGKAVVYSHALGGDRVLRRPGRDATLTLAHGAESTFCTGATSYDYRPDLCGSQIEDITTPLWSSAGEQPVQVRTFWQMSWTAAGQTAGLHLTRSLDLRARVLDLRTIVDFRRGPAAVQVRLTDTSGHSVDLDPEGGRTLEALPSSPAGDEEQIAKLWAQTVRVDPRAATGIDLAHIADVEFVADSAQGRVWVADLTSTAGAVVPAAAVRAPAVSIGSLSVPEGNTTGTAVASVPFHLSRPMDRAGQFRVYTAGQRPGTNRMFTVYLAPGQQSGTIPVGYASDRLDSIDRLMTSVTAGVGVNVVTDRYIGNLTVLDDDPAPRVSVTRVRPSVSEGESAQWRVTLSSPTDYDVSVFGAVVRGPGRDLVRNDVPESWLKWHAFGLGKPTTTLAALHTNLYADIEPGSRVAYLSIPIRRDGKVEGTDAVTLRITTVLDREKRAVTSTVQVKPSH